MPTVLPNTGIQAFDNTEDIKLKFQDYYNVTSGILNSNLSIIDNAFGGKLNSLKTNSKTLVGGINSNYEQLTILQRDKLSNKNIELTRIENTADKAIYTCPVDLELNRIYTLGTGSSPTGTVKTIILRCNLGDYTFKISNTNTVDTMQNAEWGDFNAGTKVNVFLVERNSVKGVVIISAGYSTNYFATTSSANISLKNQWVSFNSQSGLKFTTVGGIGVLSGRIKSGVSTSGTVLCNTGKNRTRQQIVKMNYGDNASLSFETNGDVKILGTTWTNSDVSICVAIDL